MSETKSASAFVSLLFASAVFTVLLAFELFTNPSLNREELGVTFLILPLLIVWCLSPRKRNVVYPVSISYPLLTVFAVVFTLGLGMKSLLLMALPWAWLLAAVATTKLELGAPKVYLATLFFLAVPWITMDWPELEWFFRSSAAIVSEHFFSLLGYDVVREATSLTLDSLQVEIEEECGGMRQLHLLILVGAALGIRNGFQGVAFSGLLCLVFLLAWIANTARVLAITLAGLHLGAEFAGGKFHDAGGLFSFAVMFCLTWILVQYLKPQSVEPPTPSPLAS